MATTSADLLVILHLAWVLFMLGGVAATALGLFRRTLLAVLGWRTLHLAGMAFAGLLSISGKLCPLTSLEYALRRGGGEAAAAEDGFIITWANRLIFPELDSTTLSVITMAAGMFVLGVYVWLPPGKVRGRLKRC